MHQLLYQSHVDHPPCIVLHYSEITRSPTEVQGAIEISNTIDSKPDPGTIRATGQDCEGWNDKQWLSFTNGAMTITDIDNNRYEIVTIGKQTWLRENLAPTRYNVWCRNPLNDPRCSMGNFYDSWFYLV